MIKLLPLALLAATPAAAVWAQQPSSFTSNAAAASSSQSTSSDLPTAPQSTMQPAVQKEVPFVSIAVGFTYLQTDLTNVPGGAVSYQLGWYGIPELHLTKHISVIADFTNFSNYHARSGDENVHGFTGGPLYALPVHGVTTFVFAEGGAIRDSKAGQIEWNAAAVGGLGFNLKLTHALAFQVVPGEYVATHLPNGNWQSNFNAKAGFVLNTFRLKSKS